MIEKFNLILQLFDVKSSIPIARNISLISVKIRNTSASILK